MRSLQFITVKKEKKTWQSELQILSCMQTQRHVWTSATYSFWCLKNFAPFTANDRAKWHFDWKTFSNSLVYNVYTNHIANRMSNYYFHYKVIKSRVRTCWFCAHTHSARARLFRNAERPGLIVLRFGVDWNSLSLTHCLSISLPCSPVVAYPFLFSSSFIYSPSLFPPLSSPLSPLTSSLVLSRVLCVFSSSSSIWLLLVLIQVDFATPNQPEWATKGKKERWWL